MIGIKVIQDVLHLLAIANPINLVSHGLRSFPQHDTSKSFGIFVHVLLHQGLDLFRSQIVP